MASTPLTVMIPLGGIGSRFQKEGYREPKPFCNVHGKVMILWVIESLNLQADDEVVIVYNPAFISDSLWPKILDAHPKIRLVQLPGPTRGAAETVLIGLRGIPKALRSRPVMLVDGDAFYEEDIVSMYRAVAPTANGVFYFEDTQPKPIYSYIVIEPSSGRIQQVTRRRSRKSSSSWSSWWSSSFSRASSLIWQVRMV